MGFRPRDLRRAMRKMGMEVEELNAIEVEVRLSDGSRLVIEDPQGVMLIRAKGQPPMLYVIGEPRRVEAEASGGAPEISDEDVALVAEQAGVSLEEARRALLEADGDIAEAILRLTEGKG